MNTEFETTFTILPKDTNYEFPLVFGGAFGGHLDLCAAQTVNRFLYDSPSCDTAVTHKWNVEFSKPTYIGDLIYMKGEITGVGKKSISIKVTAYRDTREGRELVAISNFVFISIRTGDLSHKPNMLPYHPHELEKKFNER